MERDQIAERAVVRALYEQSEHRTRAVNVAYAAAYPRISLIIPAWNEADSLDYVLSRLPEGLFEVILVDGHSTDDTIAVARRLRPDIRVLVQEGRGKGDAMRLGFARARGDIVVAIDADGSTDPREIPAFVGALLAGADYVKGTRFIPGAGTSDMTLTRKVGNWGFVVLVRMLFGVRYTDFNYGYTAFWRSLLPVLDLSSDGFEIECEMNLRAAVTKMKVVEVASFEGDRVAGEAHLRPLQDGWRVLKEVVRQWMRARSAEERTRFTLLPETASARRPG